MYVADAFARNDSAALLQIIRDRPLATLVAVSSAGEPIVDHLPMICNPDRGPNGMLRGHLARANPFWREAAPGGAVLAVFHGPQAYVSPSLYPSKREHGRVVPTWNYVVVHVHGRVRFVHEPQWLHALLQDLTGEHERGRAQPWAVSDAPADYVERQLRGIVGVEIEIARMVGKWKLSQNREQRDFAGVVAGLAERDGVSELQVVEAMRQLRLP
jgi:transcriptional regulator